MTRIAFAIVGDFGRGRKGIGVVVDTPASVKCPKVDRVTGLNRQHGREIGVYTVGVITCRRTRQEAEEYYRHVILDNADFAAIDSILAMKNITPETKGREEFERQRRFYANGMGGLPIIGDADEVARTLADLSHAGVTGIGMSLINYLDELPLFCEEVLPRLARLGLRERQPQFAQEA